VEVVVPTKPDVTLDDDVILTLSPSLNEPAVETAVTAP